MQLLKFVLMLALASFSLAVAAAFSLAILAFMAGSPATLGIVAAISALLAWEGAKSLYRELK